MADFRWTRFLRTTAIVGLMAVVLLIAAGAGFEAFSRHQIARRYPAPGRLIDIGGRRIQLDCRGTGSPVVVLISGMDLFGSTSWSAVQDSLAKITRTCSYSRAGMMWSDPGPDPRDGRAAVADLHTTLTNAREQPPYVLVGHSSGTPYSMIYTGQFPAEVDGLVFVDGSHPDEVQRFAAIAPDPDTAPRSHNRIRQRLAWMGINRLGSSAPDNASAIEQQAAAFVPTSRFAVEQEREAMSHTLAQAGVARDLGARPLYVLTSSGPPGYGQDRRAAELWTALHDDQASWSTVSHHEVIADSDHYIHMHRPDAVVTAVTWVVERVRQH
jgi:pimeloyl-ACP methyl ester carboxylesterase